MLLIVHRFFQIGQRLVILEELLRPRAGTKRYIPRTPFVTDPRLDDLQGDPSGPAVRQMPAHGFRYLLRSLVTHYELLLSPARTSPTAGIPAAGIAPLSSRGGSQRL